MLCFMKCAAVLCLATACAAESGNRGVWVASTSVSPIEVDTSRIERGAGGSADIRTRFNAGTASAQVLGDSEMRLRVSCATETVVVLPDSVDMTSTPRIA